MVEIAAPKIGEAPASPVLVAELPPKPTELLLFPKLPLELRNHIWADAASEPRYVDIHSSIINSRLFSTSSVPAILHANAESRAVGLKHYKATCGRAASVPEEEDDISVSSSEEDEKEVSGCALEPRIYVNWAVDTICVMSLRPGAFGVSEILEHAEGKAVEKIAICMGSGRENLEGPDVDDEHDQDSEDDEDDEGNEDDEDGAGWTSGLSGIAPALEEFPYLDTIKTVVLFYNPYTRVVNQNLRRTAFRMEMNLDKGLYIDPENTVNFIEYEQVANTIDEEICRNRGWRFVDRGEDGTSCIAEKVAALKKKKAASEGEGGILTHVAAGPRVKRAIKRTIPIKLRQLSLKILG